jgi:hypothetical protein
VTPPDIELRVEERGGREAIKDKRQKRKKLRLHVHVKKREKRGKETCEE